MTSSHHGPYVQGYTRATMVGTNRREPVRGSQSEKTNLSTDKSLQLDSLKLESLVIPDQQAGVNTFPGLVHTARHVTKVGNTRSRWPNLVRGGSRRRWDRRLGRSRNKVAVPEGAAGSPPF
jgi:hypothetical protein